MERISLRKGNTRFPPEVNRVLCARNLPFNISSEEMYDVFGKYGAIRQICICTSFVVYEDIYDHLSGFSVANRYQMNKKVDLKKNEEENVKIQYKYGVSFHLQR